MNKWYKDKKQEDNLTCDICGYKHNTPDIWSIVIEDRDGVLRCKVCRGAAKFNGVQKRRSSKVTDELEQEGGTS